jgi:hypothetical protein
MPMQDVASMPGMAMGMEHPQNTLSVPPLVDARVRLRFWRAIQHSADAANDREDADASLRSLGARLDNLRGLATLSRLAILGHPHSVQRLIDELHCLVVDFDAAPLDALGPETELHEDEPDDRVLLAAAVDLFAGAAFVSKNKPEQRDRFIIGIVRAIEDAIAFPVTFATEAATLVGDISGQVSLLHARIVIANARQRLIERDERCVPLVPSHIRRRLYCLARMWMDRNPVTAFFDAISGPRLKRIVHWEDPARAQPDDARTGDQVTLLLERPSDVGDCDGGAWLDDLGVMFCPHQPAPVVRTVVDGLQVLVPARARTGPIAVVKTEPDFMPVKDLIAKYASRFPIEWSLSIFGYVRIDLWAYPCAFGPPILEILATAPPAGQPVGTHPSEPAKPAKPAEPAKPANPAHPMNPANPANPANPKNPVNPANPTNPENPANRPNPENPENRPNPENPVR